MNRKKCKKLEMEEMRCVEHVDFNSSDSEVLELEPRPPKVKKLTGLELEKESNVEMVNAEDEDVMANSACEMSMEEVRKANCAKEKVLRTDRDRTSDEDEVAEPCTTTTGVEEPDTVPGVEKSGNVAAIEESCVVTGIDDSCIGSGFWPSTGADEFEAFELKGPDTNQALTVKVKPGSRHESSALFLAEAYGISFGPDPTGEKKREFLDKWEGRPNELMRAITCKIMKSLPRAGEYYTYNEDGDVDVLQNWNSAPPSDVDGEAEESDNSLEDLPKVTKLKEVEKQMLDPTSVSGFTFKIPTKENFDNIREHLHHLFTDKLVGKLEQLTIQAEDADSDSVFPEFGKPPSSGPTKRNPTVVKLENLVNKAKLKTVQMPRFPFHYRDKSVKGFARQNEEKQKGRKGAKRDKKNTQTDRRQGQSSRAIKDKCLLNAQMSLDRVVHFGKVVQQFSKHVESREKDPSKPNGNVNEDAILAMSKTLEEQKEIMLRALTRSKPHLKEACEILATMEDGNFKLDTTKKLETPNTTLGFLVNETGLLKQAGDGFYRQC